VKLLTGMGLGIAVAWSCASQPTSPLHKVKAVPLPDRANRFDYQSIDPTTGRLYLSHMGSGKLIVFDTKTDKVVANLYGYKTVTGVLAVPEEGKVYASAAGTHEVVVTDLKTHKVLARIPGVDFPDGIAYAPKQRRIFVSDESGSIDLVIDARTDKVVGRVTLGGEAGNSHYDPVTGKVWVAVQTRNEMAAIDPDTLDVKRFQLAGSRHPHGFRTLNGFAYISCQGNNKLLVADLRTMKVSQTFDLTEGPDVLAVDEGLRRLYVGCEGGAVDVFKIEPSRQRPAAREVRGSRCAHRLRRPAHPPRLPPAQERRRQAATVDIGAYAVKIALIWHGNRETRDTVELEEHRLGPTAQAFREQGFEVEPCVYNDDWADEVREQLRHVDAVQVWVNPITEDGHTRATLDPLLQEIAGQGVLVSSHPETIKKIGTKDVLYGTRDMDWGSDVRRYASIEEMRAGLSESLQTGPRVLKQFRGHSGQGIWKITPTSDPDRVIAKHAPRGSEEQELSLAEWIDSCAAYFATGPMLDQEYNPRIVEGTIRCYLVKDRIEGFGHQEMNALVPGTDAGPRLYSPPTDDRFQDLRRQVEGEWVPQLMAATNLSFDRLPMLWDIDLMFRPGGGYMLCEINVSSVYPYPESAQQPLVRTFKECIQAKAGLSIVSPSEETSSR
jgi:DNA-binding beta-propeller fold protein YncE